jgi:hypothetical protein
MALWLETPDDFSAGAKAPSGRRTPNSGIDSESVLS